jgi:hypothetical protein
MVFEPHAPGVAPGFRADLRPYALQVGYGRTGRTPVAELARAESRASEGPQVSEKPVEVTDARNSVALFTERTSAHSPQWE